jgi:hypothetical protein
VTDVLIIPGPPGLTTVDFGFVVWTDGVQVADPGVSVSVVDSTPDADHYLVSGRPVGEQGEYWTLTWEMPGGYAGAHRWPLQFGTPPNVVVPIRQAGVVVGDLSPRLYLDGVQVSAAGLTLGYVAPEYVLGGVSAPPQGSQYSLVVSFGGTVQVLAWPSTPGLLPSLPAVSGAYVWVPTPGTRLDPGGAGEISLVGSGGSSASLAAGTSPSAAGLYYGVQPGGGPYSTGPVTLPASGMVHAVAMVDLGAGGVAVYRASWPTAVASSGYNWIESEVLGHVGGVWPEMGQYSTREGSLEDPPPVRMPNSEWTPRAGEPYLEVHFLWADREGFGAEPLRHYRGWGLLQHDIYVPAGAGSAAMMVLADRVDEMWAQSSIPGLSLYPSNPPRGVSAPAGWAARQVDVPFRWEWSP